MVLVRAVRGRSSALLASAPVVFAEKSALAGTVRLRPLGDALVCVFYAEVPEPGVVYRFTRNGEVVQESESPFLAFSTIFAFSSNSGGPGGEYGVEALSGAFSAPSARIRLNHFMQVVDWGGNAVEGLGTAQGANFDVLAQARIPGSAVAASLNLSELGEGGGAADSRTENKVKSD